MELNQSEREARDLLEGGFPQVIFYGPPGTGKTRAALNVAAAILGRANAQALPAGDDPPFAFVQFHPSYNYEDFVRGIHVETVNGQVAYQTKNRIFGAMAKCAAKQPNEKHILVIDEINRANVSAVLGELIYGLEYRGKEVQTPYEVGGKTGLVIPENLRIIGTMNTADRTIGQIDYAVRRRFAFVHCPPQRSVLKNETAGKFFDLVDAVFAHLSVDHDKEDVCIGHSYFLADGVELANKIIYQVVPILREYLKDGILKKEAEEGIKDIEKAAREKNAKIPVKRGEERKDGKWWWKHTSGETDASSTLRGIVLSLIHHHVSRKPCSNLAELQEDFPNSIRPSYGVVQDPEGEIVQKYQDKELKYFLEFEEQLDFNSGPRGTVCTQWGAYGDEAQYFNAFKKRAQEFGYEISTSTVQRKARVKKQVRKKRAN